MFECHSQLQMCWVCFENKWECFVFRCCVIICESSKRVWMLFSESIRSNLRTYHLILFKSKNILIHSDSSISKIKNNTKKERQRATDGSMKVHKLTQSRISGWKLCDEQIHRQKTTVWERSHCVWSISTACCSFVSHVNGKCVRHSSQYIEMTNKAK